MKNCLYCSHKGIHKPVAIYVSDIVQMKTLADPIFHDVEIKYGVCKECGDKIFNMLIENKT